MQSNLTEAGLNEEERSMLVRLKESLAAVKDQLAEYEEFFAEAKSGKQVIATYLGTDSKRTVVRLDSGVLVMSALPGVDTKNMVVGQKLLVNPDVGVATKATTFEAPIANFETTVVSVVKGKVFARVAEAVEEVLNPKGIPVEPGDPVVLDRHGVLLRKSEAKKPYEVDSPRVRWDDIGGLEDAKREMIEAIELPFKNSAVLERYGKKPLKGLLLYGPPGCGKTMLGKAAATAMSSLHGEATAKSGFFYVKGPEVMTKWVGETESNIRSLFDRARAFKKRTSVPAVIFIDEAEALLSSRTHTGTVEGLSKMTVPTFLSEMDGLSDSAAIVLLSTNRPDVLDPAIVRDGRIDRKVKVTRPDKASAAKIFETHLRTVPRACEESVKTLAEMASEEMFSDKHRLYEISTVKGTATMTLRDIVSGAMIAGVVDKATSAAMHRDMASKKRNIGILQEDLFQAVGASLAQAKDLNHEEDVSIFASSLAAPPLQIRRA